MENNGMVKNIVEKIYGYISKYRRNIAYKLSYRYQLEQENYELEEQLEWFTKHAEITTLKPATGYLRKKQLDLVKFANQFFENIKELDICPFLIGGNLIGAYRHKGFIPWDDDLDFGLIRQDYEKLIAYCKEHFVTVVYDKKWSEYSCDKHIERLDLLVKKYPNEYILDIWVDQIQITRGTSCIDRLAIDFFAYDYYAENYPIMKHVEYLNLLAQKRYDIDYVDQIVSFLKKERESNINISKVITAKVFSGIDNMAGYLRTNRTFDWLYTNNIFPLQKIAFEDAFYYAPNNIEKWLEYEYPDYMNFPSDVGKAPHEGYKENYIIHHLPTVEFYLIDAFEIYHFLPFYYFFEKNGIYSVFVAEPTDVNSSKSWFNYEDAIKILEINGVRYKKHANINANFVFTTQDEYLVNKYKGKKIHLCYGAGLQITPFNESIRTIKGFDLKLVHGAIQYQYIRKRNANIDMIKIGYPKHLYKHECKYIHSEAEISNNISKMNLKNKPLLFYFPTWGVDSSVEKFSDVMIKLKESFFIISKAHHCTCRLESEASRRSILENISDIVLAGDDPFAQIIKLGYLIVCDAISGAATELPFLNPEGRLILLLSPTEGKNQYKEFIKDFAICVDEPAELESVVACAMEADPKQMTRNKLLKQIFESDNDGFSELKNYIMKRSKK